jgi:AAA+ ATPase superfamily predicted ATPase
MEFLDRQAERFRLTQLLASEVPVFSVVFGRRRCGKSALLRHIAKSGDVYFQADQQEETLQRSLLANEISAVFPAFNSVIYPNWESLFKSLNVYAPRGFTLFIDEFPYLVRSAQALPSILQRLLDSKELRYNIVICGSSQQMMHSLVLESSSPLYGRTDDILRVSPLKIPWIGDALGIDAVQSVAEYSVWGGIPRYWELRRKRTSFDDAVRELLFNPESMLYEEPMRLFLDDMRSAVQAYSILVVVGSGARRMSEIAARLEKPATALTRPVSALIDMGYLRRENPFGEDEKNSKRSLYYISDPFMNFYFRFVIPNKSRIESGRTDTVFSDWKQVAAEYTGMYWEQLCREALPALTFENVYFDKASRWWGTTPSKISLELDVVSADNRKNTILIGECKWSDKNNLSNILADMDKKINVFPPAQNRNIIRALFLKKTPQSPVPNDVRVFTPSDILTAIRKFQP